MNIEFSYNQKNKKNIKKIGYASKTIQQTQKTIGSIICTEALMRLNNLKFL